MNDAEKSAALLRLAGLVETVDGTEYVRIWYQLDGGINRLVPLAWVDLYKEKYISVAWKVMNWAMKTFGDNQVKSFYEWAGYVGLFEIPPAEAQRRWLDKILPLAVEAGMIPEETK
ncbi:MAG TPA: hypothetical protein VKA67_05715 [Verrucomicrobiae bacterium]|nr:hypothetical protein [Verrucomicrobiae bacterium]